MAPATKKPVSLGARALQLLAQREHSRLELRRKLLAHARRLAEPGAEAGPRANADFVGGEAAAARSRRGPPSAETQAAVDALLDQLAANGALSDARFVEARVRVRAARQGNLRIALELARHGLELSAGDAQELQASEYARAEAVWRRKFGAPAADAPGRARQMRFLAARGFSSEVVRRLLRAADDEV